jgi:hypothetical protein
MQHTLPLKIQEFERKSRKPQRAQQKHHQKGTQTKEHRRNLGQHVTHAGVDLMALGSKAKSTLDGCVVHFSASFAATVLT